MSNKNDINFEESSVRKELITWKEMLEANMIYSDIMPVIFHKLKNKLTPILGYSQIIQMKSKNEAISAQAANIEKNSELLSGLIDLLRDQFDEIEIKKEMISPEDLDLIVKNSIENVEDTGIDVNSDLKIRSSVSVVKGQIILLLRELLQNSISAISVKGNKKGCINIKIRQERDYTVIHLDDNGCGIEKDELKMVTEPFFTKFTGRAGIGYLVIDRVVKNHKGHIELKSEKDKGFWVRISFPSNDVAANNNKKKDFFTKILDIT